jgi:signal transduction histidine kinase
MHKEGGTFPVHITTSDVFREDSGLYAVMVRDITVLHDMQARAVHNEQLAAIGEMGASMAHELRNPLAAISGAIQVIRRDFPAEDARRPVMDEILEQVNRVDGIVQRLLTLSKPWIPALRPCDLRALAEKVTREAEKRGLLAGTRIVFDSRTESVASLVQADSGLVEQVYWNLLSNADDVLRGTAAEGEVRWAFSRQDGQVRVSISDSGPGMTAEVMENLFRPFYTTKTYGTGLGLLICRRIMEAHGGSMEVTSAPGAGACVTLVFVEGSD